MWRQSLTLPPSSQLAMSIPIEKLKAELKKNTNVIHIKYGVFIHSSPSVHLTLTNSSPISEDLPHYGILTAHPPTPHSHPHVPLLQLLNQS